jgi:hypothetical protein
MTRKNQFITGIVILSIGVIGLLTAKPILAAINVSSGVSLIIFSKIA